MHIKNYFYLVLVLAIFIIVSFLLLDFLNNQTNLEFQKMNQELANFEKELDKGMMVSNDENSIDKNIISDKQDIKTKLEVLGAFNGEDVNVENDDNKNNIVDIKPSTKIERQVRDDKKREEMINKFKELGAFSN